MRALTACLAFVLSVGFLASVSQANITVERTRTISDPLTLNGNVGSGPVSGTRAVTFENGIFEGHPTAEIVSIQVSISFTKLNQQPGAGIQDFPFFNEIGMVFSTPTVSTTLIAPSSNPNAPAANSFASGFIGNAGTGFDGVVTFSSTATTNVNANNQVIPNSAVTNQVYRPAGSAAGDAGAWNNFIGQAANNTTFTLALSHNDFGSTAINPLVFRSMSVTITAVPEPSSFGLCGLLTLGGAFIRRRNRA